MTDNDVVSFLSNIYWMLVYVLSTILDYNFLAIFCDFNYEHSILHAGATYCDVIIKTLINNGYNQEFDLSTTGNNAKNNNFIYKIKIET